MDVLCQFQADVLGVAVRRPVATETTVLGAASLAGHRRRRVGVTGRRGRRAWREDAAFLPAPLPRPTNAAPSGTAASNAPAAGPTPTR